MGVERWKKKKKKKKKKNFAHHRPIRSTMAGMGAIPIIYLGLGLDKVDRTCHWAV